MKYKKPILYAAAVSSILYIFSRNASLNLNKLAELEKRYKEVEGTSNSESNYAVMNNILLEEIETRVRYLEPLRRDLWSKVIGLGSGDKHEYSDLLEQANETFHRGPYYRMLRFLSNRSHMINPPKSQAGFNEILLLMNNKMKRMTQIEEGLQSLWHEASEGWYSSQPELRYKQVVQWSQDPPTGIAVGAGFAGPEYRFDESPVLKTIFANEPPPGNMYDALGRYYSKSELTTKFGYGVTG